MTNKVKMSKKSISQKINQSIPYEEQMDIISKPLNKFLSEFGEYIANDIELIKIETMINYIPLRNHYTAVSMLDNDKMYNLFSESEQFDWKNQFLTDEQLNEHNDLMTNEYRNKCYVWLNSQKELLSAFELTYSNEEDYTLLFDIFIKMVWDLDLQQLHNQ
jgi:hypothetical protein